MSAMHILHDCNAFCRGDEHCIIAYTPAGLVLPDDAHRIMAGELARLGVRVVRVEVAREAAPPPPSLLTVAGYPTIEGDDPADAWLAWVCEVLPGSIRGDVRRGEGVPS